METPSQKEWFRMMDASPRLAILLATSFVLCLCIDIPFVLLKFPPAWNLLLACANVLVAASQILVDAAWAWNLFHKRIKLHRVDMFELSGCPIWIGFLVHMIHNNKSFYYQDWI